MKFSFFCAELLRIAITGPVASSDKAPTFEILTFIDLGPARMMNASAGAKLLCSQNGVYTFAFASVFVEQIVPGSRLNRRWWAKSLNRELNAKQQTMPDFNKPPRSCIINTSSGKKASVAELSEWLRHCDHPLALGRLPSSDEPDHEASAGAALHADPSDEETTCLDPPAYTEVHPPSSWPRVLYEGINPRTLTRRGEVTISELRSCVSAFVRAY